MIHPTRKYSSLPYAILMLVLVSCAAHAGGLVLGYGGTNTSSGVGVYPQDASNNSERYFRCVVAVGSTETLLSCSISGVSGTTQIFPKPNGNWGDPTDGVTRYTYGGDPTYYVFTIGPYAGFDIFGSPHSPSQVIGQVYGNVGENNTFTFYASIASGSSVTGYSVSGTYRTQWDNADQLEWFSGDAAGIDPLGVLDGPVPGTDNGSSSNTYRFRVQYKIPGVFGLNLPPRFGTPDSPPGPYGNFANFDRGKTNAQTWGDRTSGDWWTYSQGVGNGPNPGDRSMTNPRFDDFQDSTGYYINYVTPEVVLIIDGDRSRPHYMQREDPGDTNARDANGLRFFYDLLPTDYANYMDNFFLFPYDPPGPDPQDGFQANVDGRAHSNNYVAMQSGGHLYEFIASDDFSPPDGNNGWLQVGQPGNGEYNDYMKPIQGGGGTMLSSRVNTRFNDSDGASGGFGYPFDSQDPTQYPQVNPMLTAHPYFPRGSVMPGYDEGSMTVNPPGAATDPFTAEAGYGPNPPVRVTNDDTILPNYVNIQPNSSTTPFRGGKWTSASTYTLRINYWQSNNLPPEYIRVMVRKNNDGAAPGAWRGYTMEKANPSDNTYTDGCVYQYVSTPDQLPDGGGPGDYNYQFVTSDGIRQAFFPNRPARYEYGGGILDPADLGVPQDANGNNDYYAFRVNQPPVLSAQAVTPSVGATGTDFQFKVTYTDPDGELLNTSSQGDRPFEASIYVDLFGNPQGEGRVLSVSNETTLTYAMSGGSGYATNSLAGCKVEMLTGTAAGRSYTIASNTTTTIVCVGGTTLLTDGVAATHRFRIANWFHGTMDPGLATDLNYADGKDYVFNSASHIVLGPGVHRYYFEFLDDWGSWVFPDDTNVRVEGEKVRFPFTGYFEGPEVLPNTPPVLTDFRFTPDALTGPDGTTATPFILSVTYKDEENNPPALIRLGIDGTATTPAIILNMVPDNASDNVYTDGAIYKTPAVKLTEGQHIFRAQASDGNGGRYPSSLPSDPFLFAGPPSVPTDPTSTPLDNVDGPLITANTPPTLSFQAADNGSDPANPPGLDPNTGRVTTQFTYTVIYTDTDRFAGVAGNPPDAANGGYVRVVIDGIEHDMTKVDTADNDYTDGAIYQFQITGLVEGTPHRYWFVASDGLDRARLPLQGATPAYYSGPVVDEPPGAPQSLVAQDHPADNGGVIDMTFNRSQDDGGGAGDVVEYRVYRSTTSGSFTGAPVKTITANTSPAYSLQDNTAVTGTDYYYVVRAWDGSNESANSNQEGPVKAIDNISPQPPSSVAASDPGLGGTLNVTWNLSPDDGGGQNDVKEYHIYRATTPTGFSTPVGTVTNGVTTYQDVGISDNTDYYYMVRAFDGANESVDSNVAGPTQSTDQQPPVISSIFPADRAVDVPGSTNISFVATDTGTGVDRTRFNLTVTVDGNPVTMPTPTITGTPARYTVVYNPTTDFEFRKVVNVTADAYDLGGKHVTKSWRFTVAGPTTYTISGRVVNAGGTGLANVKVSAGALWALTDAAGAYVITGLVDGTYTVTPTLRGYAFTPAQQTATINGASVSLPDFSWQVAYDISGRVVDDTSVGMSGVTISDGTRTTTTDATGAWVLMDVPAGTYNIVPSLARYQFTPAQRLVTIGPAATNQNFVGALQTFSVSGLVTDLAGRRLQGTTITATGDNGDAQAVANVSGQYTLTGLIPGRYTLTPTLAGYVFRPVSQDVDVDANVTEVNYVGIPLYTVELPAGLSFLSLPTLPQDTSPVAVFGSIPVLRYDPALGDYRAGNSDPTLDIVQVRPGRGFWVRPGTAQTLAVAGTPILPSQTQVLQLLSGWNMVGNPYPAVLPWANVGVTAGGPVSDFAYVWHPTRGYILVSDAPGVNGQTSIPQNSAMWMRSVGQRTVNISPVTSTAAAKYAGWSASEGDYVIPIVAQTAGAVDSTARAGVLNFAQSHPEVYEMDNPPFMSNSVDVYFTAQDGRALTCDIRGAQAGTTTYNFIVKTDLQNVPVKVSLPDLSQVPRDQAVILTDVASGKRLWARTLNGYTYNSGSGGERQFRLEIKPNMVGGLGLTVTPAAAKAGGVGITYTLARPASVEIAIMNLSGRTVRTLSVNQAAQPGVNSAAWDLRSDTGVKVPSGRYLIRINAAADDGQQATAVAPLMVQ